MSEAIVQLLSQAQTAGGQTQATTPAPPQMQPPKPPWWYAAPGPLFPPSQDKWQPLSHMPLPPGLAPLPSYVNPVFPGYEGPLPEMLPKKNPFFPGYQPLPNTPTNPQWNVPNSPGYWNPPPRSRT